MNLRIRLLALLALLVTLSGCTRLFAWRPIHSGDPDSRDDLVVEREGVVVRVHRFGVWNSWGPQEADVEIRNQGDRPVHFSAVASRLEVAGDWRAPSVDDDQAALRVAAGEFGRCELHFERNLELVPDLDGSKNMLVVPDTLRLQLAPLVIDGEEHALPLLEYRNPRP